MTPAARERALRQEMRAEKNLHPALLAPEGHYKVSAVAVGRWGRSVCSGRVRLHCG